jgi:hypothetical protein
LDYYTEKLDLLKSYKKAIADKFYFIYDKDVQNYLKQNNIDYKIAENYDDVISLSKETDNIFLTIDIVENKPYFKLIKKKLSVVIFDEKSLPFEIQYKVLQENSLENIRQIIKYNINHSNEFTFINENNIDILTKKCRYEELNISKMQLETEISRISSNINKFSDIIEIGEKYGRLVYISYLLDSKIKSELLDNMDNKVKNFIIDGGLIDSYYFPVNDFKTVDKIIRYIKQKKCEKFALVCFDGMGVAEWQLLKNIFSKYNIDVREKYIFSLIPTTTKISRAAIFSGQYESIYNGNNINENKAFENQFPHLEVKSFSEGEIKSPDDLLGLDVIKLVYNIFDDCAHGAVIPASNKNKFNYFKSVENYLEKSTIIKELLLLKEDGYKIFICSDHGTVVAEGNGQKVDKYLIEESCKRGVVVSWTNLLDKYDLDKYEIPFVKGKYALLAPNRHSFSYKGKIDITHGGITVDELIVPFAEVTN